MDATERETRLADAMAEYHRRRALGESPDPEEYRASLGAAYEEFREILEASAAIQDAVEPFTAPTLPRRFGRYMLTRRLGQGAMGVVFEGLDEQLGRKVAVKVLRTGFDLDGTAFERFRREARACSQVRHPAIVTVHDAGTAEGRLYYTMDVVPGASLAARVRAGEVPPLPALLQGFAGVADALHALHTHGPDPIVHRDVKPSNVIVQDDGHMVLADFGLARTAASETLTRTGDALGTPLYMSPEQALGRHDEIDARSDVYGLGATIYEALTGRPPFAGQDLADLIRRIDRERPRALRETAPEVPPKLERVVLKALEKRKEDRYPTAAALAEDLRRVAAGRSPEGGPVRRWRRAARWTARRAPVLALLLAGLLTGGWLWSNRDGAVVFQLGGAWSVRVDGERVVSASEVLALSPGEHRAVAVVPTGYEKDLEVEPSVFRVTPGGTVRAPVAVRSHTERGDSLILERALEVPRMRLRPSRGHGDGREVAWPRGPVRLEDLDGWAVAVREDDVLEQRPFVARFAAGDVAEEVPFTAATVLHQGTIPARVRDALRVGDRLRVTVRSAGGTRDAVSGSCVVVDRPEVGPRIEAAFAKLGSADPALRATLRARLLLEAELFAPALRAARSVDRKDRLLGTWGVLFAASQELQIDAPAVGDGAVEALERARTTDPALYERLFDTSEG